MTTIATLSRPSASNTSKVKSKTARPKLVQQTFQWDAPNVNVVTNNGTSMSAIASDCFVNVPKKSRPLVIARDRAERVGRCEHAGGLMEKVLSRYGISPEEFRLAVEELRASRAMNSR